MPAEERQPAAAANRRAMILAAVALPLLAASTADAAPSGTAADLARRFFAGRAALDAGLRPGLNDDEWEDEYDATEALFKAACDAPCRTRADALAKVRLGMLSFELTERVDERDVRALEQVAAWLEAK